jgi:dephospho-CoA kinase
MATAPHPTYCIGLTGGIASGKTAVASAFESLGIVVADADIAARDAVAAGSEGLAEVVAAFGADVLDDTGALDRAAMRKRVFGDDEARKRLEAIIHPRVRETLVRQCMQAASPYAIAAIPLLAEVGGRAAYPWLQRILVVDVPVELQHARLIQRDGVDAALADRMIAAQATRDQRLAIADDIVFNTGSLEDLQRHVGALDARYRTLAKFA